MTWSTSHEQYDCRVFLNIYQVVSVIILVEIVLSLFNNALRVFNLIIIPLYFSHIAVFQEGDHLSFILYSLFMQCTLIYMLMYACPDYLSFLHVILASFNAFYAHFIRRVG